MIVDASREMAPTPHSTDSRHRNVIACLNVTESRTRNFITELERRGYRITTFETFDKRVFSRDFIAFAKQVRSAAFVLCGSSTGSQLIWMLAARLLRRSCVVDCPMDITEWPFPKLWHCTLQAKLLLRMADFVLTIKSRAYLIEKFGLERKRVLFLENCPEQSQVEAHDQALSHFTPVQGAFIICCSGCHEPHRLERFAPVFKELIPLVPAVELLLIGDPQKPSIRGLISYAESHGFANRIHLLPVIKPATAFFATVKQCNMWVATLGDDTVQGRHEVRMELLEIGLLSKPVVAVRTPALVDSGFIDGEHIIFIDPNDAVESARRIAAVAASTDVSSHIASGLRTAVVTRFSLTRAVDVLLNATASAESSGAA